MEFDNLAYNISQMNKKVFEKKSDLDILADDIAYSLKEFNETYVENTKYSEKDAEIISQLSQVMLEILKEEEEDQ